MIANCSVKLHHWICDHDKVLILPKLILFHCASGRTKTNITIVHRQFRMETDPVPVQFGCTGSQDQAQLCKRE